MSNPRRSWLDRVGAAVGLGCMVHCLLVPVLVSALPLVGSTGLADPWVEQMLLAMAAGFASMAALSGLLGKGPTKSAWLLLLGAGLLLVRLGWGEHQMPGDHWFTVGVSLLLVTGHLWRLREARTRCAT
ncbi:MAG: MerC domain-containing protein [Myxococcota bacterium]